MRFALGIALFAASAGAQSQAWVVDPTDPGADFADLQAAVDQASDGDVLVVRNSFGPAPGFVFSSDLVIDGRSLTILQDRCSLRLHRPTIRATPAGGSVVLRGMELFEVAVESNAGLVWIEEAEVEGGSEVAALTASNSDAVVLQRVTLSGADGFNGLTYPPAPGQEESPALRATDSALYLEGCQVAGGTGKHAIHTDLQIPDAVAGPSDGAAGIVVDGGSLWISGSSVAGGAGGDAKVGPQLFPCLFDGGDGGAGIEATSTDVDWLDATVAGGAGGCALTSCGPFGGSVSDGDPGPAWDVEGGSATAHAGAAVALETGSPIPEGGTVAATVFGTPGAVALLAAGVGPTAPFPLAPFPGPIYLEAAGAILIVLPTDPLGVGTFTQPLGQLGVGVGGVRIGLQGLACTALGCRLGAASAVVLLDASI